MTESNPIRRATKKQNAKFVADRLKRLMSEDFSVEQKVLINDAWGLLEGIASGEIAKSQPRITEDLKMLAISIDDSSMFSTSCDSGEEIVESSASGLELKGLLCTLIGSAAGYGLTADSNGIGISRGGRDLTR